MCGLVGAVGSSVYLNEKIFHQLLVVDSVRGLDSTGVLAVFNDWSWRVKKNIGPPFNLMYRPDYQEQITKNKKPVFVWMGHNRAATRGEVNHRNAHPFVHGNLILAHNGTLHSTYALTKEHKNPFGTDSEAICYHLSQNPIEDTWKAIRGAAALSWWDSHLLTMNLITNGERPLSFVFSEDKKNLYWASEAWMLSGILNRHSVKCQEIQTLNKHYHAYFHWDHEAKAIKEEFKKLEPPFTAPVTTNYYPGGKHGWGGKYNYEEKKEEGKKLEHTKTESRGVAMSMPPKIWDPGQKQWYIWVQGARLYLFSGGPEPEKSNSCPNEIYGEDEDCLSDEEKAMAAKLLKMHPECGGCGDPFTLETVLDSHYSEFMQAAFCQKCQDDEHLAEFMVQ